MKPFTKNEPATSVKRILDVKEDRKGRERLVGVKTPLLSFR
jgi:hypothetical protein